MKKKARKAFLAFMDRERSYDLWSEGKELHRSEQRVCNAGWEHELLFECELLLGVRVLNLSMVIQCLHERSGKKVSRKEKRRVKMIEQDPKGWLLCRRRLWLSKLSSSSVY